MDQVKIEERTEIERMRETLDEMQEQGLQKTIYED